MSNEENKKNIIEGSSVIENTENKELKECRKLRDEYLAGWKRAQADFINYKKNEAERFKELKKFVNEDLLLKILPILDNLEIAINHNSFNSILKEGQSLNTLDFHDAGPMIKDNNIIGNLEKLNDRKKKINQGFLNIKKQIEEFLKSQGIEEIKSVGKKFDPNFHEAVEEIETENKKDGIVAEEIKKGYILNGRVIRPAKVKITK